MLLRAVPRLGVKPRGRDHDWVISANRARARQRWIVRATLSLVLSAALLFLIVCVQRDRMAISESIASVDRPVAALQTQVEQLGQLPAAVPDIAGRAAFVYAPDEVRRYARDAEGAVIVGTSATQHLILRSDGNAVVIYEGGRLRTEWWTRARLARELHAQEVRINKWDRQLRSQPPRLP